MPDHIKDKGASLCVMAGYCFERLEEQGVKTHYRGLVRGDGHLVKTGDLKLPTSIMEVNLVRVLQPDPIYEQDRLHYDYGLYKPDLANFLIPLEIIYRNSLSQGSSIFKRLAEGEISLSDLGLDHEPKEGEDLEEPIFDISTKLEARDRYLSFGEAKRISGLQDSEFCEIKEKLDIINNLITEIAGGADLKNEDGKIELVFNPDRELMVVDVIGTLDESRFTCQGLHVSKEVARLYYRQTEWYHHLLQAKEEAETKGIEDWKGLCEGKPPKLDQRLCGIICNMYKAAANECTRLHLFEAPPLSCVIADYKSYLEWRGNYG
jgi:phosphoribosylaminoimidazole-succinocarboxamide synthase